MDEFATAARQAFAEGWAATGGPLTDRVKAGCVAAVELACAHRHDPHVLEVTLRLGHLEGTWARVYDRRDDLHARTRQSVGAVWRKAAAKADVGREVRRFRHLLGVTEAEQDQDFRKLAARAIAAAVIGGIAGAGADDRDSLVSEVADALRQARAEGWTDMLAVAADQAGATGFDYDQAYADAYDRLGTVDLSTDAGMWLDQITNGVTSDLGDVLAADADASYGDTMDSVDGFLAGGDGYPDGFGLLLDYAVGFGLMAGALDMFSRFNVTLINFITAGDGKVCEACQDAELNGPYHPGDAPLPPLHVNCRCATDGIDVPADAWSQYV